uniref:(northern house mosquito) hypothetical protein n=1 Tax=Culex pipiens TaxID=7175 RepID=A0A8D8CVR2_CULPI
MPKPSISVIILSRRRLNLPQPSESCQSGNSTTRKSSDCRPRSTSSSMKKVKIYIPKKIQPKTKREVNTPSCKCSRRFKCNCNYSSDSERQSSTLKNLSFAVI